MRLSFVNVQKSCWADFINLIQDLHALTTNGLILSFSL
jgi:hypothetical protein